MSNFSDFAGGGGGLEPGDSLVSARALGLPEFISETGVYLKADFPKIADLNSLSTSTTLWESVTSGTTTTLLSVATDGNGVWVAAGSSGLMIRSADNGLTWSAVTSGFGSVTIRSVAFGNGVWVAGGNSGVITRSTDSGLTWSAVTSGFGTVLIRRVVTDGNGVWIASGNSGRATRSSNNGATWSDLLPLGMSSDSTLTALATDRNGIWLIGKADSAQEYRRSFDNGLTWGVIAQPPGPEGSEVMFYADDAWVVGGGSGVIWRSVNNGGSWSKVFIANLNQTIKAISADNSGVWVAASSQRAARSTDNGLTWFALDQVFPSGIEELDTNNAGVWITVGSTGQITRSEISTTKFIVTKEFVKDTTSLVTLPPLYLFTGETS